MQYRRLGKSEVNVSVLGYGCMRLPMNSTHPAAIFDPETPILEEAAIGLIQYAADHGVNYFDTGYIYHGGQSEALLGKAVQGFRENIQIATKLPTWMVEKPADCDRFLEEQLANLRTDYIDFYLLHGLGRQSWEKMQAMGIGDFLDRIQADGRAKFVGFSFHDDIHIFKEIIDAYDWATCQIQYNYFDEEFQAGREGLEYAAAKDIGVVIMEPLRGGKLVDKIPQEVQVVWDAAPTKRSPAQWALEWVWNHPEVATLLSGMSNRAQLEENIGLADNALPGTLTSQDLEVIARATDIYRGMLKVDCTSCAYCMPCPEGVNIPMNFSLYNDTFMFKDAELAVMLYNQMLSPDQQASNCAQCLECEEKCPQKIEISEELKKVHDHLAR